MTTLNHLADVKADLPKGMEKKLNKEGKVVPGVHKYTPMHLVKHSISCFKSTQTMQDHIGMNTDTYLHVH